MSHPENPQFPEGDIDKSREFFEGEPINLPDFEVSADKGARALVEADPAFAEKMAEIKGYIDETLGLKWNPAENKVKVHLFSDQAAYQRHMETNFPGVYWEDMASFDQRTNTVFSWGDNYASLLSGMAHELTHLHPFYGGVGNEETLNMWEQEMVCALVGDTIRERFEPKAGAWLFDRAKRELAVMDEKGERFSFAGVGGPESGRLARMVYPWIQKHYGIDRLRSFWTKLSRRQEDLEGACQAAFGKDLVTLEDEFAADFRKAKSARDIK